MRRIEADVGMCRLMERTRVGSILPTLGLLAAALALGACESKDSEMGLFDEGDGSGDGGGGDGADDGGDDGGGDGGGDGTGGDDGGDGGDDGGIKYDVDPGDTGGPGEEEGCDFVDILFLIDNSASMTSYQNGLIAAFPTFAGAMIENLPPDTDLHVGVTTSSFCDFGTNPSHSESNCVEQETLPVMQSSYVTPDQGTVPTPGFQGRLRPHGGITYFEGNTGDAASMTALQDWFANAAAVGSMGCNFEFNASGVAYVFHEANAAANDGFLRDEGAALMIFILSDEADQSYDVDDAQYLHDLVVNAKAGCGGEMCIVTGGLLSPWCTPDQSASFDFLSSFGEEPVWGSIGQPMGPPPDYKETVGEALAQVLAQTCDEIPPVG
jgi:hypothetical protein